MKVIFIIANMSGGGSERVISILANKFIEKNIDTSIVMTAGNTVAYELDSKVETVSMGSTTGGSMKKRLERIKNMRAFFSKDENKDAILISFGPGTSFYTVMADMGLKHKLIISERNNPGACPHPILRNIVYRKADVLSFQTKMAMECFPKSIQRKGVVIANPIRNDLIEPYKGEREQTVVAVGRLEPQKNYPLLLTAFSIFKKNNPDWTLHIYGQGFLLEELKASLADLEINDTSVIFEGFCKDVNERIKKSGMYVLSSDFEGISNALLEAMALEIPVISTDCPIGGSSMCIENGLNGMLTPVGNAKALADAMDYMANHTSEALKMGVEAGEIRRIYSEDNITNSWIKVLEEIK